MMGRFFDHWEIQVLTELRRLDEYARCGHHQRSFFPSYLFTAARLLATMKEIGHPSP